ncbi:MAG: hypothetical protein OQK94_06390 [Gammaproteobacteria bacterium]|nr:hypothetical protein [Gammaproteobacteria bacterium]MCW8841209.1 hypothetical protein [Gammaproteobacteria bacterium]MCW8959848.1 hypothetical protein [Gammaproteobacteria bacterium]MCW8973173.1 hypothetical protein [Gammaproteobacteria bacterium]MCW8991921.1 hypothetical protein [Gammaproteobacteria bacterium]
MRITTTLRPGQKGTKHLTEKYGERLVCVRYRLDQNTGKRYTTIELIEQESETCSPAADDKLDQHQYHSQRLGLRIEYWETDLREKVKQAGGIWRPRHKLWELPYSDVVSMGLESRVVGKGLAEN